MFGASETPYDLRFQALGIPVRVHPMFWLVAAMLGWQSENIPIVLIWVGCVFLSILVHEYGHGLMARAYGASPSILLQAFGGLCFYPADRQTPRQRLAVLIWGPGAGFVLCLATMAAYTVGFGLTPGEHIASVQKILCGYFGFLTRLDWMKPDDPTLRMALKKLGFDPTVPIRPDPDMIPKQLEIYWFLLEINILWGLINLLPIWPLDGGQITQTVLAQANPYHGRRWAHILSLLVAATCAILVYTQTQSIFNTLFFAYFAVINYQILDSIHRAHSLGIYDENGWGK